MICLPNVEVHAQIYNGANSVVYRGVTKLDSTKVILKVLKQDYPSRTELARYKQEYSITSSLNVPGGDSGVQPARVSKNIGDAGGGFWREVIREIAPPVAPSFLPDAFTAISPGNKAYRNFGNYSCCERHPQGY